MSDNALNIEIARLLWPKMRLHYDELDTQKERPLFIASGKPLRTHMIDLRPVPNWDTSYGAALELLEHVLRQTLRDAKPVVSRIDHGPDAWLVEIVLLWPNLTITNWGVTGESLSLPAAIAIACRAALRAIKETAP